MQLLEKARKLVAKEEGRVLPYAVAWWLGVPLFLLVIIYLIRGH